jgi:hypothetical protein
MGIKEAECEDVNLSEMSQDLAISGVEPTPGLLQ